MSAPALGRAWVLNLDADDELAHLARTGPSRASRYAPSRAALRAMEAPREILASTLLEDGDVLLVEPPTPLPEALRGMPGRAFCPTPRALALLERAGALPEPSPSLAVLLAVGTRAFAASWRADTLPAARFVGTLEQALDALASESPTGQWMMKRARSFAGRGQRRIASRTTSPCAADLAWIRASMSSGGLQIEPRVQVVLEAALHGWIDPGGTLAERGRPCVQRCDARGAWQGSRRVEPGELARDELAALEDALLESAAALGRAGYFGPFGIDAFRWRAPDGTLHFRAPSELNARYTMGWPIGMAGLPREEER